MPTKLVVHDLGPQGDGVHRAEAGPVYVERALPGETVEAKMEKGAGGAARGTLMRIIEPSPHRAAAPCKHYEICGGCSLQHADEAFYRDWKSRIVREALEKKALRPQTWGAPIFLPAASRRRAAFAAVKHKSGVTLGYHRRRTHDVTEISECLVADPVIMACRAKLPPLLAPLLQRGRATDVFIQTINGLSEVVITGPRDKKGLALHEAVAHMAQAANISRVAWRARERDEPEIMLERAPLMAKFGELNVTLAPRAFLQPTKAGEEVLVRAVMDALPVTGKYADLFSGCGTFAGSMLTRGPVDAFEHDAAAVRALSRARGGKPLNAVQRDLFRAPLSPDGLNRYDAVLFDPPRAGAHEQAKALADSKVPRVIGVSCNPATFARDARILTDGGYTLDSVTVVDQFIWSHHVELVAVFSK
jgi:23S rRNA (uracil1939-C5)-methyltransferase